MHTDNVSIIVGDLVHGGKEFRLSSEAGDARARAKEWYDKITQTIDLYKDMKRAGFNKKTEVEGTKSNLPDKPEPEKREVIVDVKKEEEKPGSAPTVIVEQKGNTTITTEVTHSGSSHQTPKVDMINPYAGPSGTPAFTGAPPSANPYNHSPSVTTTYVGGGYPNTTVYTPPPVVTPVFNTYAGPSVTTVYPGFSAPVMTTSPLMMAPAQTFQCRFCTRLFQPPPAPMFACPFCNQLNQMQQTTVTTFAPVYF